MGSGGFTVENVETSTSVATYRRMAPGSSKQATPSRNFTGSTTIAVTGVMVVVVPLDEPQAETAENGSRYRKKGTCRDAVEALGSEGRGDYYVADPAPATDFGEGILPASGRPGRPAATVPRECRTRFSVGGATGTSWSPRKAKRDRVAGYVERTGSGIPGRVAPAGELERGSLDLDDGIARGVGESDLYRHCRLGLASERGSLRSLDRIGER